MPLFGGPRRGGGVTLILVSWKIYILDSEVRPSFEVPSYAALRLGVEWCLKPLSPLRLPWGREPGREAPTERW